MNKPITFAAGPAALPESVLAAIRHAFINWQDTGVSILEIGHRTAQFAALGEKLEASVRRILNVPDDFSVLFLPGGAQIQFAMVTMNLVRGFESANFIDTGYWSSMAMKEAQKYTTIHLAASSQADKYRTIPALTTWSIQKQAAFLHFTDNETIGGVEFPAIPAIDGMVLVSDMSSNIFSRPIDFSRIGCVYACAQKNMGIAGMSLILIRRDLLDRALPETPAVFHYATQARNRSLLSTPTTFAWYVASLVLDWIEAQGGITAMAEKNRFKAQLLYDFIDASEAYQNPVDKRFRSRMNVPFTLAKHLDESQFFKAAASHGLLHLEGHRSVGGARASIYNAIRLEDVKKLIDFLKDFGEKS